MDHPRGLLPGLKTRTLLLLAGTLFFLLFSRSMSRFLDLDEHQFVAPPLLLNQEGYLPYRDYPYFHMPNLIFVYALVLHLAPYKLLIARLLSVLCGTATVALLFGCGWRWLSDFGTRQRWLWVGGTCAVYICSRFFTYADGWAWNHDSAVLCGVGSLLAYCCGLRQGRTGWFALAGFLAGAAMGIRLSFALLFVPMGICLTLVPAELSWRQRCRGLAAAAVAFNLALVPSWYFLLTCHEQFVFGNLEYPRFNTLFYRRYTSDCLTLPAKIIYIFKSFATDPGNIFVLTAYICALIWAARKLRPWRDRGMHALVLLLAAMPFLAIGAIGPSPVHYQYIYMLLPVMVLTIFAVLRQVGAVSATLGRLRVCAIVGIAVAVGTGLPRWYWPVLTVANVADWVPLAVHNKGLWVREQVTADTRVLTIDPLIPLEAGVHVYPDYAVGRFVQFLGLVTTAEERQRYHLTCCERLDRILADSPPAAIFCDERTRLDAAALVEFAESWQRPPACMADGSAKLWTPRPIVTPAR
jgi:4-amino-4-deoxy-L-arabinose transferase-like glycosyltransferase